MSSPEIDHRDRRSSSLNRNSGRSYSKSQYEDYGMGNRQYRERSIDKSQVVASGFPSDVTDRDIKSEVHNELERFGDIISIHVRGREQYRQAVVTFREEDAARELRRFCLERHCKVVTFQRTLHFDFDSSDYHRGGDFRGTGGRGNYYNNRGTFNQRNDYREYRHDRYNDRNDYDRGRNFNHGRDRFHDNHINPRATRTLFVGNLDHEVTKEELMRIFDHWGAIDDIDVKRPPNGVPAYAFIKYLELEAAASAKNQMFGKEIHGRPIKVGYGKTLPSSRLWIGGLGNWCSIEMLNREFDRFGALRHIEYVKGSRHAFIEFESLAAASEAHTQMRGFPLGGPDRKIKIDYAEVDRKRNNDEHGETENRSDEEREHNRYDDQNSHNKERGRDSYHSYRQSDNDKEDDRGENRRSRSPLNGERGYRNRNSSADNAGEGSPKSRTQNDSLPSENNKSSNDSIPKDERPAIAETNVTNNSMENLQDVSKRFVVAWRGAFALKNSAFPVRMHLIGGNPELANFFLRGIGVGAGPAIKVLSITQRLRLDPPKLDEVSRRIQQLGAGGHCVLLALPTGDDIELDGSYQRRPLKSLVTYFKKKEAAGVIILNSENAAGKQEESGMLHAFPPCEFSQQQLLKAAPNVGQDPSNEDHLIVIVVKGTTT